VVLLDSGKGVVFCGDHVLESVNPVPLLRRPGPDGERPPSLVQYVESLRASRRVDAEVWLPGHGEVIRDHRGAIDRLLERFQSRAAQALDALKQGPKTPYGLARDQSRRFDPRHLYIAVSLATGLLELLEHEGRARSWRDNGLLYYEAI
jgi:glyoxylase-like metal-dependent hydrolase (beta-lactamase superfamily II)